MSDASLSASVFRLDEAIAILERTPAVLRAMLDDLPATWLDQDEGPDTFSVRDVVGHLLHGERTDWMPRVRTILEHGDAVPFEPFDRWGHRAYADVAIGDLLGDFAEARAAGLAELRTLVADERVLDRAGRHPSLGRVTLRQLLAAWVAHDMTHHAQIARIVARRYVDDVGPWIDYLGVLQWRR